jgi:DUF4097 and DUF4098 domain-containing protein YvlB
MSWLYSLVFAGLVFSSDGSKPADPAQASVVPASAEIVVGDEIEKFEQSYPLTRNGRVSISNVNGSITIEAWDRDEVRLEATKIADSKETLADVDININSTADSLVVEADHKPSQWHNKSTDNKYRKLEVEFRLSVPRTAVLNEIQTVNGSVTVSNFTNITKISAVNGNVTATNLRGTAHLGTVNGQVNADFDRVDAASKINLSTVNGKVILVLPSDVSATLKADSLNGSITNDFGLPVRKGEYVGRDMYGRIGSGGSQIKLNSVNGGLAITRKSDGRSPSPAVNLLSNKKADDEWHETSRAVSAAQINREVDRAVRESQRAAAVSMRDATKVVESMASMGEAVKAQEIKKLEKMKVIDEHKIKSGINEGMRVQRDALRQIRDAAWYDGLSTIEKKRASYAVRGTPRVSVEAKGCSVSLRGWDKNEVQYVVTEVAGRRGRPAVFSESHDNSSVTLKVVNNGTSPRMGFQTDPERVHIQVYVPRKANLKVITDGEIRLDGVSGDIELTGDDESINVRDVDGNMSLVADEALVRVIGFRGDLNSQTACGDVYLEGDFRKLSAKATDGTVTLTVPQNANATFTSNTDVESDGVEVVRENERTWRLGRGGSKYNFDFNEGKLVVRSSASVSTF